MGEWLPVVLGFGYAALVIASVVVFPRSAWARELTRSIRLRPRGPRGTYTRGDHFRSAVALAFGITPALWLLGWTAYSVAQRFPNLSRANHIAAALGFTFIILGGIAGLGALLAVAQGVFFRTGRAPADAPPLIETDAEQLRVSVQGVEVVALPWLWVERVATYKQDLLTTDEILLVFEYLDPTGTRMRVQLSEEWTGFAELFARLPATFDGFPADWYVKVMAPAFATNGRVLWERPGAAAAP